jgi:beta-glucosidase
LTSVEIGEDDSGWNTRFVVSARAGIRRTIMTMRRSFTTVLVCVSALTASMVPATAAAESAEAVDLRLDGAAATTVVINANGLPYLDRGRPVEQRVADLLGRMTIEEKVGQMTQAERAAVASDPTLVAQWRLGSVLSGGGSVPTPNTPAAWVDMVNSFQDQALSTRLHIPMIYGIDAVHGHGNVYGATIFPHNVGIGATRDPALAAEAGRVTAEEMLATGIPWDFAPCVCVSRDERWGRSYESFGEDPALVERMSTVIDGLQDNGVLATVKHYAGDGDTEFDQAVADANEGKPWYDQKYPIDQGVTVSSRRDFARVDLAPYENALRRHDAATVMPSFSSVDWTEDGVGNPVKMHANRELITGELKGRLRFDGFVISDWEGIHQIPDPADPANTGLTAGKVRAGVNAGIDMFMEPNTAPRFEELLLAEVAAGRVEQSRIDDAVSRILRRKFEMGLFEKPYAASAPGEVGGAGNRAVARRAVAESQVLLKNSGRTLPLRPAGNVYVAGRNADNIGNQAGGWTIQWQGDSGATIPGTTILEGIREVAPRATVTYSADASAPTSGADVGIAVVGETPYAEGYGDVGGPECGFCAPALQEEKSLALQPADQAVVDKVCAAIATCVVLVVSGRPQVVGDPGHRIDALVASWLPGSEGSGVADVLFGRRPFTGRLPVSWPARADQVPINVGDRDYRPLYPYGWGLRTGQPHRDLATTERELRGSRSGPDDLVAVARDAAQEAVVRGRAPANWPSLIADAEHQLMAGNPIGAWALLIRATHR